MTINNTNTVGYTPSTPQHFLLNQGAVYTNYGLANEALLGACNGGNEFDVAIKTYNVKVGNITSSNVKGLQFITDVAVSLKVNLLEVTTDTLHTSLQGSVVDTVSNPDYDIITLPMSGTGMTYLSNITLVSTLSGSNKPVIIKLFNAQATGGIKVKVEDSKDNTIPVTFEAFTDPLNPKDSPFEIRYPKLISMVSPFNLIATPVIDNGKVLLTFSDTVQVTVPKDGFAVTLNSVANVITASTRGVNNLNTILLTVTTIPTAGQLVTVTYTKPGTVPTQVTSLSSVALESFVATNVVNNLV